MLIGYLLARAADADTLAAQRQALQDAGCEQVVEDRAAGSHLAQPELGQLLERLREGDVVVVPQLDGLGRSLPEVVESIQDRGVLIGSG